MTRSSALLERKLAKSADVNVNLWFLSGLSCETNRVNKRVLGAFRIGVICVFLTTLVIFPRSDKLSSKKQIQDLEVLLVLFFTGQVTSE